MPETLGDLGEIDAVDRGAGNHHEVVAGRDERLVGAKDFAHAAFGAVAMDGFADGGAGSDYTDA